MACNGDVIWQPIELAPTDGSNVLANDFDLGPVVATKDEDGWKIAGTSHKACFAKWTTLPPPPTRSLQVGDQVTFKSKTTPAWIGMILAISGDHAWVCWNGLAGYRFDTHKLEILRPAGELASCNSSGIKATSTSQTAAAAR